MKRILKWIFRVVLVLLVLGFVFLFVAYWRSTNECGKTAAPINPMKAIVRCDYGLANLKLEDVEKPVPDDDQILVKVHAVSVNPYDWHFVEGTPYVMRAIGVGLRKPKEIRLGVDFAGTVEAVGKNVTQFKPGDEVFGGRDGAFAEYVCRRAVGAVAPKPAGLTFEQAASINIAGITALQGVRDKGKVQPGQKVLINGASGGVGTFAVQIAKSFGAEVTGRLQHAKSRTCAIARRGSRHRLYERGFHQRRPTLRRDSRQRGEPLVVGVPTFVDSQRHLRLDRRRRSERARFPWRSWLKH